MELAVSLFSVVKRLDTIITASELAKHRQSRMGLIKTARAQDQNS